MIENGTIPQSGPDVPGEEPEVKGELIRIVIADDHPIFRDGLRKLGASKRTSVSSPRRAMVKVLEVLDEHQPDILLLDLKMPGLDGLTARRSSRIPGTRQKSLCSQPRKTRISLSRR
jgi:two-component system nitrate/nitrite response regulator NarL